MKIYIITNNLPNIQYTEKVVQTFYYTMESVYYFDKKKIYKQSIKQFNSYQKDNMYIDSNTYDVSESYYIPYVHHECIETFYNYRINENVTLVKHVYDDIEHIYYECVNILNMPDILSFISNN
jgi:hypothetical protein